MLHQQQQQKQEEAVCSKEGEEASASVINCRQSPCRKLVTILKMSLCTIKAGENVSSVLSKKFDCSVRDCFDSRS